MKVTLWGTRGSLASPGPETVRYGGNTSCVSITCMDDQPIILDAGSGIRTFGRQLPPDVSIVHILLTHLHMDHVVGLPFFAPLLRPGIEVHIWGPASTNTSLEARINRYLSPPLFPLRVRDVTSKLYFHELPAETVEIGEFKVKAQVILHPNPTVGYRIQNGRSTVTYLPDHEPALGVSNFPRSGEWTSGFALADGSDLLIHDSQYTGEEYLRYAGYGHSSLKQAMQFARICAVKEFVPFHHDPSHDDDTIDQMIMRTVAELEPPFVVTPGMERLVFELD